MNKIYKIIPITLIIVLFITIRACDKPTQKKVIKKTIKEEIIQKIDSSIHHKQKPTEKIIVVYDTVEKIVYRYQKTTNENQVEKEVYQVKDTFNLTNSTVFSTVLSEGKVLENKVKVKTHDKIIRETIEIENTIYKEKSTLFLNIEPTFDLTAQITGIEASVDYTVKNKIRLGAGIGWFNHKPYASVKLGIPLN
ncbi:hypothetical protein ACIVBQ_000549 [Tenacibaculum discolor]